MVLKRDFKKGVLRTIDANMNRAKEGLRVAEDIFRFIVSNDSLRMRARKLRHGLDVLMTQKVVAQARGNRNASSDCGKKTDYHELRRADVSSILYSNLQRTKESLRVLEEFFKLTVPRNVSSVKRMRYKVYTLEKDSFSIWR